MLAHGGTDPQHSGFVFHFQAYQDMLTCRDEMSLAIPAAFQQGTDSVAALNIAHNLQILAPVPMAEAWVIFKTAVLATDYKADSRFFVTI